MKGLTYIILGLFVMASLTYAGLDLRFNSAGLQLDGGNITGIQFLEGDGYTLPSDTSDLQTKLDSCSGGCHIKVPCGEYEEIIIKHSGTKLEGSGICTLIKVSNDDFGILTKSDTGDYLTGITITDLKINPESTCSTGTQTGIYLNYSKFATINRVDITGLCGTGIKLNNWARHNTLSQNNIDMTQGQGVYITGGFSTPSNNNRIQNNQIQARNGEAVQIQYYANSNTIVANQLYAHNASVVEINEDNSVASKYNSVLDNHILYLGQDNAFSAVYLNGSQYGSITGNIILGNSGSERPSYCVDLNTGSNYNDVHSNRCLDTVNMYPNLRNTGTVNQDYNGEYTFLRVTDTTTGGAAGTDICIDSNNDLCQCGACA